MPEYSAEQSSGRAAAHLMSRVVSDVTAARAVPTAVAAAASSWLSLQGGKINLIKNFILGICT